MKYIEHIKSFFLAFLILLSIVLTLLIWNYKPDYETMEETQIEEVFVGQQKQLHDILQPYRLLYRQNEQFYGTVAPAVFNDFYNHLRTWKIHELDLINNNLSDQKMNEMLRDDNRVTMFFNEEIPLEVFSNLLLFDNAVLNDASFSRLIVDWSNVEKNDQVQLLFLNTEERFLFRSYASVVNKEKFLADVIEPANNYTPYVEIERDSLRSLYVVKDPVQSARYTYLVEDNHNPVDLFRKVVFPDQKIVTRNVEAPQQSERYNDGTSLMTVDTQNRIINYVYPTAESIVPILTSDMLLDSFDYVNDHGGFTLDFRLSSMNVDKHITAYQLFIHGHPVYSNSTTTSIVTTWGENRIYRYRRPFYQIDAMNEPLEQIQRELASGEQIIENIRSMDGSPFMEIEELVVGYHLTQDDKLIYLEPGWFAISDNGFTHLTPEYLGGVEDGLE